MTLIVKQITQLEDYPRPTSLSFEKLKEEEEGEGEEGAVLYVPSKGVTLQVAFSHKVTLQAAFSHNQNQTFQVSFS